MFSNRKIILIIILLLSLSITAYVIFVFIPRRIATQSYEAARKIGRDIEKAFQFTPEITVDRTIIVQQQSPRFELVTLSQTFQHQYEWTNQWLGSTKKIKITGTFEARAGFDLNESFNITFDNQKAIVSLPPAEILAVEPLADIKFEDEHGVWNWINETDRSNAVNAFTNDARRYAEKADFVHDAQRMAEAKLEEILLRYVPEVEFRLNETPIDNTRE